MPPGNLIDGRAIAGQILSETATFDKKTGEIQWVAQPGGRPTDTVYSSPIVTIVNGLREFIIGGSDGAGHALKPQDGEWRAARELLGERSILGATVNNPEDARRAVDAGCLDYAGVGPLRFAPSPAGTGGIWELGARYARPQPPPAPNE